MTKYFDKSQLKNNSRTGISVLKS